MIEKYILDAEWNPDGNELWCVSIRSIQTGMVWTYTNSETFSNWLYVQLPENYILIGHNIVMADRVELKKRWDIDLPVLRCVDTLLMSRLMYTTRIKHDLESWGETVGCPKSKFSDFSHLSDEMIKYCEQDTLVTQKVLEYLEEHGDNSWKESIELEHHVARITAQQIQNGFKLDVPYAEDLVANLRFDLDLISDELIDTFGPTVKTMKTKVKLIPFNPGSRDQIADRLMKRGWVPTTFTPTGKPEVNELTIAECELPEARLVEKYLLLQKRISQIADGDSAWLKHIDSDNRIHGNVITNGAITGRMTHSKPNIAQVPNLAAPYGKECRTCFIAEDGKVLVDIDASGLELRMLAHYMQDKVYTDAVVKGRKEDGTDVHSVNMRALGIKDRDVAKTWIYAYLYGAGDEKLGKILGCSKTRAKELRERFLKETPALAKLKKKVEAHAKAGWMPGLDDRKIYVRSEHAALNTLLQGAGAVVMKKGLILLDDYLTTNGIPHKLVANVHDEWVIECLNKDAEQIGMFGKHAIIDAGKAFNLRCPLDGEYSIGNNWSIH